MNQESLPIELHLDVEDNYPSSEEAATESIKNYLRKLKSLKKRYKDIVNDLLIEENMNI